METQGFNSDKYKDLLDRAEDPLRDFPSDDDEVVNAEDCEVLPPTVLSGIEKLKQATVMGLPYGAAETIKNGRDLIRQQTQEAKQVSAAIGDLFNALNQRYGFDIQWDPNSFSANLKSVMASTDTKTLELYISEGYSKVRVILYQQFLSSIVALAAKVLDPAYLMSNSLSFEDQMTSIEKLFSFIEQMNSIYDQVHIENTAEKLEHLKEAEDSHDDLSLQDPNVRKYLEAFRAAVLNNSQQQKKVEPVRENVDPLSL